MVPPCTRPVFIYSLPETSVPPGITEDTAVLRKAGCALQQVQPTVMKDFISLFPTGCAGGVEWKTTLGNLEGGQAGPSLRRSVGRSSPGPEGE